MKPTPIWLDIESGTWGTVRPIEIQTFDWTDSDWQVFDIHMSDTERQRFGEQYGDYGSPTSPTVWYAENCVE